MTPDPSTTTQNRRIAGLDAVKLIAMLSVVVSHALNVLIVYKQDPLMTTICHSMTAGGVPLFFMVSGYLLLGRKEVTPMYARRKVFSITRYVVVVCLVYWGIMALIPHNGTAFWPECLEEVFRTTSLRGLFTPFWFLWSMAVIYAILPMLHNIYKRHTKVFALCTGVLGVLCIGLFVAQLCGYRAEASIIQPLRMWKWLFFFAAGGVLRAYPVPRLRWGWIAVTAVVLNAAQRCLLEPLMHDTSNLAFAGSPISMLFYLSVFCWAMQRQWKENYVLRTSGALFMPVYTIHYIIIQNLTSLHDLGFGSYVTYPLLICVLSVAAALVILHLPVKGGTSRFFKL